jgi:hypothetical protein
MGQKISKQEHAEREQILFKFILQDFKTFFTSEYFLFGPEEQVSVFDFMDAFYKHLKKNGWRNPIFHGRKFMYGIYKGNIETLKNNFVVMIKKFTTGCEVTPGYYGPQFKIIPIKNIIKYDMTYYTFIDTRFINGISLRSDK